MNAAELDAAVAVMKAAADGDDIECRPRDYTEEWEVALTPCWDWDTFVYRVKIAVFKVELLGWFGPTGGLLLLPRNGVVPAGYRRVPSEDRTVEVVS